MTVSSAVTARDSYPTKRFASLEPYANMRAAIGLEIGACDKPTIPLDAGFYRYADFRSAENMVDIFALIRRQSAM